MGYFTNLRVKFIRFWSKNKKYMLIGIIIFLVVITINNILKNMPKKIQEPSVSYKPSTIVLSENGEKVPEKQHEEIVNLVDIYFNYCNNAEYEKAYNCITEECKEAVYPSLEIFTEYVKNIFEGKKKTYNVQAYSVVDNTYVYNIRILDDILANGTSDGYYYYQEKLILKEENGEMKLSIGEFVGEENLNINVEDENMIIRIASVFVDYETETYKIVIENKSNDKYIVVADGTQSNEVILNSGTRQKLPAEAEKQLIVKPGSFVMREVKFNKFYDDGNVSTSIKFGAIRILKSYDYNEGTTEEVLNNALELYSLEVPLK